MIRYAEVLETTAKAMRDPSGQSPEGSKERHPAERYRGDGGATQIFIPDRGISCLGGQPLG